MLTVNPINIKTNYYNKNLIKNYNNPSFGETKESVAPMAVINSSSVNFGDQSTKSVLSRLVNKMVDFAKSLVHNNLTSKADKTQQRIPVYYA